MRFRVGELRQHSCHYTLIRFGPIAHVSGLSDAVRMSQQKSKRKPQSQSIMVQFKTDIKAAQKLRMPWRVLLSYGVFCLAVIVICDRFGKLNMSLPLLNCVAVFGLLICLKWQLKRQPMFWATMVVLAAIHVVAIWYVPWTSKWLPALAIATISSVDFCLMLGVINIVGRHDLRPRPDQTGS